MGATRASGLTETTLENNRACAPVDVPVDLAIAKTAGEPKFDERTGTWGFQYTLTVTNVEAAHNGPIQVSDAVPAGLTFTSVAAAGWTCTPVTPLSSGSLACTRPGPIAHNQTFTITITVTAKTAGTYEKCADVGPTPASGYQDANTKDNRSCIPVKIEFGALSVSKILTTSGGVAIPLTGLVFPVTVTCGANVTNGTITTTTPLTVNNLPKPSTCTVTEGPFPALPANACPAGSTPTWLPVSTSATVTVSTGSTTIVPIRNELQCKPAPSRLRPDG